MILFLPCAFPECGKPVWGWEFCGIHQEMETHGPRGESVGDKLILTRDIYEEGEDLPPGVIARKGDVVIVRRIDRGILKVSHEPPPHPGAMFRLEKGEYKHAT